MLSGAEVTHGAASGMDRLRGCHVVRWINFTVIRLFSTVICRKIGRPYSTTKETLHGCIKEDAILSKVKVCSTAMIDYYQYRNR